jgi:hypothetical protein
LGGTRAELIAATVPTRVLAALIPPSSAYETDQIRQVSNEAIRSEYRVKNIEGFEVHNCSDLHTALDKLDGKKGTVQVDFVESSAPTSSAGFAIQLDGRKLSELVHQVAPDCGIMRMVEDGNPCLVLRSGDRRCRITTRVERKIGLLQVVVSIATCAETTQPLPIEMRAWCDGSPLRCLTTADSLNLLYGNKPVDAQRPDEEMVSFASVSEHEEYLLPTNYKQLSEGLDTKQREALLSRGPALVALPGTVYPGPPILGDARALAGFLLQRKFYKPADPEVTGWVMFSGDQLRNGATVEVAIDLGAGLEKLKFHVPE